MGFPGPQGPAGSQGPVGAGSSSGVGPPGQDGEDGECGWATGQGLGGLPADVALKSGVNAFTGTNSFATNPLNLIVGQLQFPVTQNASSDANTLDDYEEGTWTPVDASGASLTFTNVTGYYIKIGQLVQIGMFITFPATVSGAQVTIGGLPFTVLNTGVIAQYAATAGYTTTGLTPMGIFNSNATTFLYYLNTGAAFTNVQAAGTSLLTSATYRASS